MGHVSGWELRRPGRVPRAGCVALASAVVLQVLAACTPSNGADSAPPTVTVLADTSWRLPAELRRDAERQLGVDLVVEHIGRTPGGLAASLARKEDPPRGDVVVGVDATTARRVLSAGALRPYTSPEANKGQQRYAIDRRQRLSAVDIAEVCVNVDDDWFAENDVEPPTSYEDLTASAAANRMVVPSPATSSEGLAFLLGTIAEYGADGWQDYWSRLRANGVLVVPDAEEAYNDEFAGAKRDRAGDGRPIVVADASSPAAALTDDELPQTSVLEDTCYEQVRYAGVLTSTTHRAKAERMVDFLLSQQFQSELPAGFGTYPTREGVELPDGWDDVAPQPSDPATLPVGEVGANAQRWVSQWRELMDR